MPSSQSFKFKRESDKGKSGWKIFLEGVFEYLLPPPPTRNSFEFRKDLFLSLRPFKRLALKAEYAKKYNLINEKISFLSIKACRFKEGSFQQESLLSEIKELEKQLNKLDFELKFKTAFT